MKSYLPAFLMCILACTAASGCVPPAAVQRTLLIPAPSLPARVGRPLDPMHGRASFEVSSLAVPPAIFDFPAIGYGGYGEPGVLVPRLHLGLSAHLGLFTFWEAGVRVLYTHASWAKPNFVNVIELSKEQDRGLYEISLGQRFNVLRDFGPKEMFNLALLVELGVGRAPVAVFCRVGSCDDDEPSADEDYVVHQMEDELYLRPQVAASFGVKATDQIYAEALAGVTTSLSNIGFDTIDNIDDDTEYSFWIGYVGAGFDVQIDPVFMTLHAYMPFHSENKIYFGPRFSMQAGYAF